MKLRDDSSPVPGRSRITNGRDVLPNVDGRSIIARRFRDIVSAMVADQGGTDQCSESRIQLIRRFAAAAVLAEQMEAELARGKSIDIRESMHCSAPLWCALRARSESNVCPVT
jgi:hypothetical protein